MNARKSSQLGKHVSGHSTTLFEHIIIKITTCFDMDFTSQIKLTKLFVNSLLQLHLSNELLHKHVLFNDTILSPWPYFKFLDHSWIKHEKKFQV